VTDALEMGGIARGYSAGEAAIRALEAGADALLMPSDTDAALKTVTAAVQSGRLTRARIQESVVRILTAKERVGLDKKRFVDLEGIGDVVDAPEANEKAQEVADRAVTLVRNQGNLIPLAAPERTCYVTMPESRFSSEGQVFTQEIQKRWPKAAVTALDSSMARETIDAAVSKLSGCPNFAVAIFTSFAAYRGTVGMPGGELGHALQALIATGKPVVLIALGNPYMLRSFPTVAAYLATFSNVPCSEIAAVRALNGEIAIRGHLPVSIPEQAKYGEGIQVPATRPATANAPIGAATVRER
jgi:beta-N-acetylhexosaminidase